MSRASVLARGRAAALAGMVDACQIRRITSTVTNPETGQVTKVYGPPDPVYSGRCRVQQSLQAKARPETPGEAYVLMLRRELQLPMTVTGLKVGDEVTITASPHDPDLINRMWLIRDLMGKSEATARRIGVEEQTS